MSLKQIAKAVLSETLDAAGYRLVRRAKAAPTARKAAPTPEHLLDPKSPLECAPADVERWNTEWLRYLGREWTVQLRPHHTYTKTPDLPDDPRKMWDLCLEPDTPPLSLFATRDALLGQRVMEMGCGCGNLGKLLGRYAGHYLGTDYSTMALQVARLVSPDNCSFVHVADRAGLEPFFETIDTVVGRFFWIHQNRKVARKNLEFMQLFLKPGGRIFADFYYPDPELKQGRVFLPNDPLSAEYPSATFRYEEEDVRQLIEGTPFQIESFDLVPGQQRRYAILRHQP